MSNIVTLSWDDDFAEKAFWHISQKPNLHKLGIKKGHKTLNNYHSNTSNAVFIGSMTYCLTEYPKYTKNGIYHLYKIDRWHMYARKGEWIGKTNHYNTKKTDQFKCYEDIPPTRHGVKYYGQYKIKNGIAIKAKKSS